MTRQAIDATARHYVFARIEGAVNPNGKRNTLGRIVSNYGYITVEIEAPEGEHHSTTRAAAHAFLKNRTDGLGNWELSSYLGPVYYRREDGYLVRAKRFSTVRLDRKTNA